MTPRNRLPGVAMWLATTLAFAMSLCASSARAQSPPQLYVSGSGTAVPQYYDYGQGMPPQLITPNLTANDADSTMLQGGTVRLLGLQDLGSEWLGADMSGTNIESSYNPSTGLLHFTGVDTVAHYQAALRTVTYENTKIPPTPGTRQATYRVTDTTWLGSANSVMNIRMIAPHMVVMHNGNPVTNGGAPIDFGTAPQGGPDVVIPVTLTNTGIGSMTISEVTSAGGISAVGVPWLVPSSTVWNFNLLVSSVPSTIDATLTIHTNDYQNQEFDIRVTGSVVPAPVLLAATFEDADGVGGIPGYSNDTVVNLVTSATGLAADFVEVDTDATPGGGIEIPYAPTVSVTLAEGFNSRYVRLRTGSVYSYTTLQASISVAPVLLTAAFEDADGAGPVLPGYSNDPVVNLVTTATGLAADFVEVDTDATPGGGVQIPYAPTVSVTLPEGTNSRYIRLMSGSIYSTPALQKSMVIDTTPPAPNVAGIDHTLASGKYGFVAFTGDPNPHSLRILHRGPGHPAYTELITVLNAPQYAVTQNIQWGEGLYEFAVEASDRAGNAYSGDFSPPAWQLINDVPNSRFEHLVEADGDYVFPMEDNVDVTLGVEGYDTSFTLGLDRNEVVMGIGSIYSFRMVSEHLIVDATPEPSGEQFMLHWRPQPQNIPFISNPSFNRLYRLEGTSIEDIYPISSLSNIVYGPIESTGTFHAGFVVTAAGNWTEYE